MGHEAKDGEDDEAGEHARDGVGDGDDDCILLAVPGEAVVGGQGYHTATGWTKGEDYLENMSLRENNPQTSKTPNLCSSIHPNPGVPQLVPVCV